MDSAFFKIRNAHYTYNQGVAIAVLAEMYLQTNDKSYLELAEKIADATITTRLVTDAGFWVALYNRIAVRENRLFAMEFL